MSARTVVTALVASLLLAAGEAPAQLEADRGDKPVLSDELTLQVPLNLTRLSPSISTVAVECTLMPTAGPKATTIRQELPVSAGAAVGTANLVFPASATTGVTTGTVLNYTCTLTAFSTEQDSKTGGWKAFDATNPVFNVTPIPKALSGRYTWGLRGQARASRAQRGSMTPRIAS